jgi:surface antigen-like variable number repeat protein
MRHSRESGNPGSLFDTKRRSRACLTHVPAGLSSEYFFRFAMNKNWVLLKAVLLILVGFPSVSAVVQAADATTRIEVLFEGNRVFTEDQLRSAMLSREHSQVTRGSNVTEELQQGLQRLREFLMAEGYLTPRFGKPRVEDRPTGLIFKGAS